MLDVIIPVYNTPKEDLDRCFESITNQTYKNFTVYVIDDGSTKATATYLDEYSKKDKRFIINHRKNGGVSSARNYGLSLCKSEYITFIDADDTIEKCFFKEAIKLIKKNNLDQVIGKIKIISQNNVVNKNLEENDNLLIYSKKELPNYIDKTISGYLNSNNSNLLDVATGRIYCKIYKRSTLNNSLFLLNLKLSEDTLFCIDSININSKIGVFDKFWYNYYQNEYSALHQKTTYDQIMQLNIFVNELNQRKKETKSSIIKNSFNLRIIDVYYYIFKKMIKLQISNKEFEEYFKNNIIIHNLKSTKFNNYINYPRNHKIFYYFLTYFPYKLKLIIYIFLKKILKFKKQVV